MSDLLAAASSSPALPVAPAPSGAYPGLRGFDLWRARIGEILSQPAIARTLPMFGLVAVVAASALIWMALREPPQRDLFRGLPDTEKAAVADVLDKSAIAYRFDDGSGAITVGEDDYFKAKMTLASAGLPKSAPDGNSLLDTLPMGASRAVEGEKLRTAREMDLARTIEAIDSVEGARVHLAVEPPSIFLRDRSKAAASVMLRLAQGRSLADEQVQAIVHLVASSVSNLSPEAVSVVDQNGRLLSNPGGIEGETNRQIAVQSRIEERYRQALVTLLTPMVGAGKFSTEVHAEVNFDERQATRETYPQDEARLRVEQGSWQAGNPDNAPGVGNEPGGIPGALSNVAPAPATPGTQAGNVQATQGGASAAPGQVAPNGQTVPKLAPLRTQETFNRSFELGREISVTQNAVGTVKRLSVAVALDNGPNGKPLSPQEVSQIEALVKGAVGFDAARGDSVALSTRSFAKPSAADAEGPSIFEAAWFNMLVRNLSALAAIAVLIFGVGRPMLKKMGEAKAAPPGPSPAAKAARRREIGQQMSQELAKAAQANPSHMVTLDMISSTPDYAQRADLIRNFVKQDPDRAALVVRDLLREGRTKENA